jgi:hypothetical protein
VNKYIDSKSYKSFFKCKYKMVTVLLLISFMATFFATPVMAAAPNATVSIDLNTTDGISTLELGVTHTNSMWDRGNAEAVSRAKGLLNGTVSYNNVHIMGWGTENPQPVEDGPYVWEGTGQLDERVQLMRELGGEMVLTLCTAPGWMKTSGSDWNMGDRVADEHVEDFVALCRAVAERYTDVKYFQVWNEMKGYFDSSIQNSDGTTGNWDYIRYTDMYNRVYTAIKEVRPDAKVGGFYLPIAGDGSVTLGKSGSGTFMPLGVKDLDALDYWLKNKVGADFICVDRWLRDWHNGNDLSTADHMALTSTYKKVIEDIRAKTELPIWFSEYYSDRNNIVGDQYIAAAMASIYYNMIKAEGNSDVVALLWNPTEGESLVYHQLFTSTATASGAQKTPHYDVYKAIQDRFAKGTQLYKAVSSDPNIEVLASIDKTMIINKYDTAKTVLINGNTQLILAAYEVKFVDTPRNLVQNGGFENGLTNWTIGSTTTAWRDTANSHSGSASINFWKGSAYTNYAENTITNCAPGRYDAKMWVRGGGTVNSVTFEVYGGESLLGTTTIAISDAWTEYTLENMDITEATDLKLRVSIDAVSNVWLYFDDFELIKKDSFVLEPISITTEYGNAPVLPSTVNAVYYTGETVGINVTWDTVNPAKYNQIGSFTVSGTVQGAVSKATANITVIPLNSPPFTILSSGTLDRTGGIKASVTVGRVTGTIDHTGNEVVIFQLMKGNKPVSIVALEKNITAAEELKAYFDVPNSDKSSYAVKVFILDTFNNDTSAAENLASPITLN